MQLHKLKLTCRIEAPHPQFLSVQTHSRNIEILTSLRIKSGIAQATEMSFGQENRAGVPVTVNIDVIGVTQIPHIITLHHQPVVHVLQRAHVTRATVLCHHQRLKAVLGRVEMVVNLYHQEQLGVVPFRGKELRSVDLVLILLRQKGVFRA